MNPVVGGGWSPLGFDEHVQYWKEQLHAVSVLELPPDRPRPLKTSSTIAQHAFDGGGCIGAGKRLFANGTIPAAFKVTESIVGSNGVIVVNYERAGAVKVAEVQVKEIG